MIFLDFKKSFQVAPSDIWGMIRHPVKTLHVVRERAFSDVILFILITGIVYAVMFGLVTFYNINFLYSYDFLEGFDAISTILIIYLLVIASTFFNAVFIHIFVIIVEGKKGLFESLKVVAYASAPSYILGWIPAIGILAGVWALIVQTLALKELHEISTGRAILAMILPYVMFACIFVSLLFIPAPFPILE